MGQREQSMIPMRTSLSRVDKRCHCAPSWRYVTEVKLGSPPQELTLVIDTGDRSSWVSCGCPTCPKFNSRPVRHYNPSNSSSATIITCGDKRCASNHNECSSKQSNCEYKVMYEDQSTSTGFLVSDNIHLDTIMDEHFSTSILFGCSNYRSGLLDDEAIDGVLGKFYDVNLQSIAVNGEIVDVDPSVFKSKDGENPSVDSGARFVYLGDRAYGPVISALTANVSQSAEPQIYGDNRCFKVSKRIDKIFPPVTFNFKGGASMTINPKDYLFKDNWDGTTVWCLGFYKNAGEDPSLTVLGDLMLRDKIIVYDIANKRIGWANHNCYCL